MQTHTLIASDHGPVILWVMYPHKGDESERMAEAAKELKDKCTMVAIQVDAWNRDLSPWSSELVDSSFAGDAAKTLNYIEESVFMEQEILNIQNLPQRRVYIMGYSLAGLFALWSMYQIDAFAGCATCSGSLWYPGFTEYVESQPKLKDKKIYLSLGGKESRTPDKLMATVGDRTKSAYEFLKKDNRVIYEINSGGHFADSVKRLMKAVRWIVDNQ